MRPADAAWGALATGVLAYEIRAGRRGWELLSEAVDRYRRRHPLGTDLLIVYLAGHLLRRWPARLDPLTRLAGWLGR